MFTGIITDLGSVQYIERNGKDVWIIFNTGYDTATLEIGTSMACNGCCLTVIDYGIHWFGAHITSETLEKTTLDYWYPGQLVNFERAMRIGDTLSGHLVFGHVDGIGYIKHIWHDGKSKRLTITLPLELAHFTILKGSISLDGVSLTINKVAPKTIEVSLIPYTQAATNLGRLQIGDQVNIEIDMLVRYISGWLGRGEFCRSYLE